MDSTLGLEKLVQIIRDDIKHKDYDRVVNLADIYYKMVTGDGISDLLKKVVSRESDTEFEMRKTLTNSIIPPTLSSTKLPFQKVVRKQPLVRKIDWETGTIETKKIELETSINQYWGDASLEKYLEYAYVDFNYTDPNAFIITEFEPFDSAKEKARPYPFLATSAQAIMFEIKNNILEYVVIKLPIKYESGKGTADGYSFTMYLGDETIMLTQVESGSGEEFIKINEDIYKISLFFPKAKHVPARRIGYRRDGQTQGRTFVSPFHDVIPYLNKTLKIDSELDLSSALTAFPQRIMYVGSCKNCNKGKMPDGADCPVCDGAGKEPFHNSTMDVITLDMPRNAEDIINLEQLLVYKSPPVELLEFQKNYINELRASVYMMMFNKELYSKDEVAATATEKVLEIDNMNDTLNPFARSLSTMWKYIVDDIATFTDKGDGLILEHIYPTDFKFKNLSELMAELKAAKDADASTSTIAAIEDDINELLYADRPEELKIIRIKNSINPFRGYSEENVRLLLAQKLTTEDNAILWSNLESIFNDLEQENINPWLYDLNYEKIIELVKAKVAQYKEVMVGEKPAPPANPFNNDSE